MHQQNAAHLPRHALASLKQANSGGGADNAVGGGEGEAEVGASDDDERCRCTQTRIKSVQLSVD